MSAGRRKFRIIKEIAEGGFGKVFLAEQISSDGFSRIVAVKLLHAKWSSHDEVVQRTRDEARLLGLVRHQHIVKVEDLTSIDGKCAIVMEYLEGVDLKWMTQFLKDKNEIFPRSALFEIILAVASALDAAYNSTPLQGGSPLMVIHRDIKPSNIFVTVAGGVKVLDFGTARANFAEREAKTQALAFGSQGYMAPERMLGEEDTPAADIFSLGITLYELLTLESFGRIPPRPNKFQKKIEERVAAVKLTGEPEWCDQVRDTLRVMLSYDPKERPTAAQLVEIMELLAQEAGDMGLRRYCRTLVAEAKAALPDPEANDPLAGTLVDEDASAGTGAKAIEPAKGKKPEASKPPPKAEKSKAPEPDPARGGPTTGASGIGGRRAPPTVDGLVPPKPAPPPLPAALKSVTPQTVSPQAVSPPAPAPQVPPAGLPPADDSMPPTRLIDAPRALAAKQALAQLEREREAERQQPALRRDEPAVNTSPGAGGGSRLRVALLATLLVVVLAVLVGVATGVLGLGGIFVYNSDAVLAPVPDPVAPKPPEPPKPEPEVFKGSKIVSPDTRPDVKTSPTTLTFGDPAGALVEVKNRTGFALKWDGKAPFGPEPLPEGAYSSTVTMPDGKTTYRLKQFKIEAKGACAFTFDPLAGEWTGGCK